MDLLFYLEIMNYIEPVYNFRGGFKCRCDCIRRFAGHRRFVDDSLNNQCSAEDETSALNA